RCDNVNFRDSKPKPASQRRSGYGHAQKIRAATTNLFGVKYGLGSMEWHKDPSTGRFVGNPSISPMVSRYMLGLQRRKAQAGEAPTSARAITSAVMRKLYRHNRRDYGALAVSRGKPEVLTNRLLQACYTLAFICLLRFDEVLRIQMQDITFNLDGSIELRLPFRKTDQHGGATPFILWPLDSGEAHLCPYRALCEWLDASGIKDGFLFPKLTADGLQVKTLLQTAEAFLEYFRNNLLDVGVAYSPYGTHSFRRGGCQYLVVDRRWNIRRVCEWGGWSTEFTHLTIVKYIISFVDEPMSSRADFFRPGRHVAKSCRHCGRSCPCNS
ncbi:DNA breaking-rejoining enzyme, partial [Schizophyllum commune]